MEGEDSSWNWKLRIFQNLSMYIKERFSFISAYVIWPEGSWKNAVRIFIA